MSWVWKSGESERLTWGVAFADIGSRRRALYWWHTGDHWWAHLWKRKKDKSGSITIRISTVILCFVFLWIFNLHCCCLNLRMHSVKITTTAMCSLTQKWLNWLGLLLKANSLLLWCHKQFRRKAVCLVLLRAFLFPLLTFSTWIRLDCIAQASLGLCALNRLHWLKSRDVPLLWVTLKLCWS